MAATTAAALPAVQQGKQLDIERPTVIQVKKKKQEKQVRIPVHERKYKGANVQIRPGLAENYEGMVTEREHWWRPYIRETPLPGAYEVPDSDTFIKDLQQSIKTYSFKSDGRRLDSHCGGKGAALLPGAYNFKQMTDQMRPMTYSFKNSGRGNKDILNEGIKDKNINVPPNQYETEKYDCTTVVDPKNKHSIFKSGSRRFPTVYFKPRTGPAPGQYNARHYQLSPTISSSFKSSTPRFKTSHTKVPGPGMYEPTFQSPPTKTLEKMGRVHGLFFTCSFQK